MKFRMGLVALALVLFHGVPSVRAQQQTGSTALAHALNDSFADVFEKVAPSVVIIRVQQDVSNSYVSGLPQGLDFSTDQSEVAEPVSGSGLLIRKDGYILTNQHVVDNAAPGGITVLLKDGRKLRAELVGIDKETDLAVIKIPGDNLPVADLGDSDKVRVGQFAFAIGASENLPFTFTAGVVSGKDRSLGAGSLFANYEDYIQTDAPINPGNSGGPLCDIDGRVVGINTLILGLNRGIGFAIPVNMAKDISGQLIASGRVSRPQLGIRIRGLEESTTLQKLFPDVQKGVFVADILQGSTADESDLRQGDVILRIDSTTVGTGSELQRQVLSKKIGQIVKLDVWRDGRELTVPVKTGEQGRMVPAATHAPRDGTAPGNANEYPGFHVKDLPAVSGPNGDVPIGVQVTDVIPGSVAAAAGIEPADIIIKAGDSPVRNTKEFDAAMAGADSGRGIMFVIRRDGENRIAILSVAKPQ